MTTFRAPRFLLSSLVSPLSTRLPLLVIPEREILVKGRTWEFCRCAVLFSKQHPYGGLWRPLCVDSLEANVLLEGNAGTSVVAVLCGEVVEPIFSCAAAPHIHPFVNPSAESAAGRNPVGR